MVDHRELIRACWHLRHESELVRICIRRAIDMLQSFKKHGVWGHPPIKVEK